MEQLQLIKQRMRNYYCLHLNLISHFNEAGASVCLQGPPQAIESGTTPYRVTRKVPFLCDLGYFLSFEGRANIPLRASFDVSFL